MADDKEDKYCCVGYYQADFVVDYNGYDRNGNDTGSSHHFCSTFKFSNMNVTQTVELVCKEWKCEGKEWKFLTYYTCDDEIDQLNENIDHGTHMQNFLINNPEGGVKYHGKSYHYFKAGCCEKACAGNKKIHTTRFTLPSCTGSCDPPRWNLTKLGDCYSDDLQKQKDKAVEDLTCGCGRADPPNQ